MPKPDIDDYISRHQQQPHQQPPQQQHAQNFPQPGQPLGGVRVVDSTRRAKLEHEAMMTAVLAVLICWLPFATIFTLVAGAGRWSESRRSFGGNNGAFATVFSAVVLVGWLVLIATYRG